MKKHFSIHNHSVYSNFRLKDSTNKIGELVDYCVSIGLSGIALSDHETTSGHISLMNYVNKQKKTGKIPEDFTIALGNEIYLLDREETEALRSVNAPIKFHHFLLMALNRKGHDLMRKFSSMAWENSFYYRGMERVPTYYDTLLTHKDEIKGNLIGSSACLGGHLPQLILNYLESQSPEDKMKIHNHITMMIEIFGEGYYLELQPSNNEEQINVNKMLLKLGEVYGLKCIVTTDSHYLNREHALVHEIYLRSDEGEREVAEFYSTTYFMSVEELRSFFPYLTDNQFDMLLDNCESIRQMVESYSLDKTETLPNPHIPTYYNLDSARMLFEGKGEYIDKYLNSEYEVDRYYITLLANGFHGKKQEDKYGQVGFERIETELKELWLLSEKLEQRMSQYFLVMVEIIDTVWETSLVGVSRGSASGYYTNYLLDIVQINPLEFSLPHWRFLTHERPELPDIDFDTEASQRENILALVKEKFGAENVLNCCTYTTEGTRSAILTACRGLQIDVDIAQGIANLIPNERGRQWSLSECLYGNKEEGKKPHKPFIDEIEKYEGLRQAIEGLYNLISGRSVHASAVIIYPNGYIAQNSMMKSTKGLPITQYNMGDSQQLGGVKYDFLTTNAMDKIRTNMELLLKAGKIEWQGSLRATYNKYFHPDVIEWDNPLMFEALYRGDVINAFQFETPVGSQALQKIKPQSFDELCAGNSLMRLGATEGISPLDKYVLQKNNVQLWYDEMREFGLNEKEIQVLEKHVAQTYGMCDTQEALMMLSMDENVSNFDLAKANKLRKGVAKVNKNVLTECKEMFLSNALPHVRPVMLEYVWEKLFKPQFGYAFSKHHVAGYTTILMQEMYTTYKYGAIFWKTACLTVNAGLIGETEKTTDFGSISKAICDMEGYVLAPCINRSELGFTPLENENKILFGLKPISGLGTDATHLIMENRPYNSIEDFVTRMVGKNKISEAKAVTLVKAGCFDSFQPNRFEAMKELVSLLVPKRERLTAVQYANFYQQTPKHLFDQMMVWRTRTMMFGKHKNITEAVEKWFLDNYSDSVPYEWVEGKISVQQKDFDKFYKKATKELQEWIKSEEAKDIMHRYDLNEFWKKHCLGSVEKWEMSTNAFYTGKHELDYVDLGQFFNVRNFSDLDESPTVETYSSYRGRQIPRFYTHVICGTVLDKDKNKGIVAILTKDGVVNVRFNKGQFTHYDKKVVSVQGKEKQVLDPSWFERGSHVAVVGFRRGNDFIPRTYKHSMFQHTCMKLHVNGSNLQVQTEKVQA